MWMYVSIYAVCVSTHHNITVQFPRLPSTTRHLQTKYDTISLQFVPITPPLDATAQAGAAFRLL
jgi:hypothetical protein